MANKNTIWIILGVVIVFLVATGKIDLSNILGKETTTQPGTVPGGCAVEPTFTLLANDKWSSTVKAAASDTKYKINGGPVTVYSGSSTTAALGDKIEVAWAVANNTGKTPFTSAIESYTISTCGRNSFSKTDLMRNTTITLQAFNEVGTLNSGAVGSNETIDSGEGATLPMRFRTSSQYGFPRGGVIVVELAQSVYDEGKTTLSGGFIQGTTNVPSFYTVSSTSNVARAWKFGPSSDGATEDFTLYVKADTGQNPLNNNIIVTMYTDNCYEDTTAQDFKCGLEKAYDSSQAGYKLAPLTIYTN
jgi:hypothetical protein